jgi:hypothetical protein
MARRHKNLRPRDKKTRSSNEPMLSAPNGRLDDASNVVRGHWLGRVSEAASALAATHASRQLDDDLEPSRKSTDWSAALVPVNELVSTRVSPNPGKSRFAALGGLVGIASLVALTAFLVIDRSPLGNIRHQLQRAVEFDPSLNAIIPSTGADSDFPAARLVARPRPRVVSSGPTPLDLAVEGRAVGAVVIIRGLLPGMELSTGDPVAVDAWQVSVAKLGDTWIAPPENFTGSLDLIAELRLPNNKVADRLTTQFEWVSSPSSPAVLDPTDRDDSLRAMALASASAELQEENSEPLLSPSPGPQRPDRERLPPSEVSSVSIPSPPDRDEISARSPDSLALEVEQGTIAANPPVSSPPAQHRLDQEEITVLLKRGKTLIASGDLAAARIVLRRAADANNAEAALALAATYDPVVLRELKVYGFTADPAMARAWYEKATELGSSVAPRRLKILSQGIGTH